MSAADRLGFYAEHFPLVEADSTYYRPPFRYLYRRDELEPWVGNVATLARDAEEVHVLMNNCYRDYGVRNAQDMIDLLVDHGAEQAGS